MNICTIFWINIKNLHVIHKHMIYLFDMDDTTTIWCLARKEKIRKKKRVRKRGRGKKKTRKGWVYGCARAHVYLYSYSYSFKYVHRRFAWVQWPRTRMLTPFPTISRWHTVYINGIKRIYPRPSPPARRSSNQRCSGTLFSADYFCEHCSIGDR